MRLKLVSFEGRSIFDGVAAAQEIISNWFHKKSGGILLKLDFAKACDMVDWDFLLEALSSKGFGSKWISWIKVCLCGGKS